MNLIIIACLILVMNYVLTYIQVRYYRKAMDKLISKYRGNGDYYLYSGQARRKIKSGSIAMLIVDKDYTIMECQVMKGVSILSSFKEIDEFKGQHVGSLLSHLHEETNNVQKGKKHKASAVSSALMTAAENALLSISKKKVSVM
ncbi:transcriptional regulator GutM [Virgibacillus dakarensis]|nr:transcriptional regulator GutM [Virgibacillus dakarensis]